MMKMHQISCSANHLHVFLDPVLSDRNYLCPSIALSESLRIKSIKILGFEMLLWVFNWFYHKLELIGCEDNLMR